MNVNAWQSWASLNGDPRVWENILYNMGVDEYAMADWFVLANHAHGRDKALAILHKLLKKNSGGHSPGNVNGFVVACCKSAWHELT